MIDQSEHLHVVPGGTPNIWCEQESVWKRLRARAYASSVLGEKSDKSQSIPLYLKYKLDQSSERDSEHAGRLATNDSRLSTEHARRLATNDSRLSTADTVPSITRKDSFLRSMRRPEAQTSNISGDLANLLKTKLRTALYASLGNIPNLPEQDKNFIVSHHQLSLCDMLNDREGLEEEGVFLRHLRESAALEDALNEEMERQRSILMQKLRQRSRSRCQTRRNEVLCQGYDLLKPLKSPNRPNKERTARCFEQSSAKGNSDVCFSCLS